jgi:hypothetical protein
LLTILKPILFYFAADENEKKESIGDEYIGIE